jgi:hypothetical protein
MKESIRYILDNEDEVSLLISYSNNLDLVPNDRLKLGDFDLPDDLLVCDVVYTRRTLKPRFVTVKSNDRFLKIICKTKERLLDIINNPDDFINDSNNTTDAIPIKYTGESYCIKNDSSS